MSSKPDDIAVLSPADFAREWQQRQSVELAPAPQAAIDSRIKLAQTMGEAAQQAAPKRTLLGAILNDLFSAALDSGNIDNGVEEITIRRRPRQRCTKK